MAHPHAPYRIWVAGETEWLPGPSFQNLESALDNARKLAVAGDVAIELPTREWHTFRESSTNLLGPSTLARGSDPDLGGRASAAINDDVPTNRAYKLTLSQHTRAAAQTLPGTGEPAPHLAAGTARRADRITRPGTGTETASARSSGSYLAAKPTTARPTTARRGMRRGVTAPMVAAAVEHSGPERRDNKRYLASEVLDEPACTIQSRRTEIVDISEDGLQIVLPAGVRVQLARPVTLVFSGHHGCFELHGTTAWVSGRHAGVRVEKAGNVVGRMFMRKMIANWLDREKKRKVRLRE